MRTSYECLLRCTLLFHVLIQGERCLAENNALWRDSVSRFHQHAGWRKRLRHDIRNEELWKPDKEREGKMISVYLHDWCRKRINIYLHLKGRLAVRHSGRALSADDDGHVEAVAGESSSSAGDTEGFSQGVPRLLAENWVDQLDDLILGFKHRTDSVRIKTHRCIWKWIVKRSNQHKLYLFQWGLHVHMIREGISSGHEKSSHLKSLFKLQVQASKIIQTGRQVLKIHNIHENV